LFQFSLNSARAQLKRADDLALIKAPIGVAEQKPQNGLAGGTE
jgi:hypothetical protein